MCFKESVGVAKSPVGVSKSPVACSCKKSVAVRVAKSPVALQTLELQRVLLEFQESCKEFCWFAARVCSDLTTTCRVHID